MDRGSKNAKHGTVAGGKGKVVIDREGKIPYLLLLEKERRDDDGDGEKRKDIYLGRLIDREGKALNSWRVINRERKVLHLVDKRCIRREGIALLVDIIFEYNE